MQVEAEPELEPELPDVEPELLDVEPELPDDVEPAGLHVPLMHASPVRHVPFA